jgi:predicted PurR-regulated permease PerM
MIILISVVFGGFVFGPLGAIIGLVIGLALWAIIGLFKWLLKD